MQEEEQSRHDRLERLYDEASKLAGDERRSFLNDACADDQSLRQEVERLIALEPQLVSFDEKVLEGHLRELESLPDVDALQANALQWLPERIGAYAIKRRIGSGGMGVVFEAVQDSPKRRVALKLSNPMVTTEASLERLRLESEFLGRLQHPGIAQIYEAGVHELDGQSQPYFAMEFIDGQSLLDYANEEQLDRRARVALMIAVCEGVQHAHDQGVVHRDLKPENIFVDRRGQPKLLDFGMARLIETADVASTLRTQAGEVLGTLAYMAPEQASGHTDKISEATDVFSLGVIAYQLLSGRLPRDMEGMTITSALEVVSQTDPRGLRDSLTHAENDLDTVIGKSLEIRQRNRYRSADEFGADLGRFLGRRPISAKPPTALDRLSKYVRRNKLLVSSAAAIGLLLSAGLVVTTLDAHREADRRRSAMRDLYASEMLRLTDASSRAGSMPRLDEPVAKWIPEENEADLRGWEWRFLNALRQNQSLTIPLSGLGMAVDWHPSGERVVVASTNRIEVFDVLTLDRIATWSEGTDPSFFLNGARFSPDGERVLFHGWDLMGVWKVGDPEPEWVLKDRAYRAGAWSPDGSWVIASDEKRRSLVRYDARSGEELAVLTEETPSLMFRNISADGELTTFMGAHATPTLFDLEAEQGGPTLKGRGQVSMSMKIDPSGRRIAESGWSNLIRIYPLDDLGAQVEISDHNEQVGSVDWHPSEALLASGSGDASVRVYNGELGTLMQVFRGHTKCVRDVRWSPDGRRLASASEDEELRIWDLDESGAYRRRTVRKPPIGPFFNLQLNFNHDSSALHVSHRSSAFTIAMPEGRVVPGVGVRGLESLSVDGSIRTFVRRRKIGFEMVAVETETALEVWSQGHDLNEHTVRSWHPTQRKLLAGVTQGFEMIDFTAEPQSMWTVPANDRVSGGAFDAGGTRVVLIEDGQPTRVVEVESGRVLTAIALPGGSFALAAAFSPDRALLALAYGDGVVRIYDPSSGAIVEELSGHSGKVYCVGWHPTEPRIATGSADGSFKLWDTSTFTPTASFQCGAAVKALDWGNDGHTLAAMTATGTIHFWDAFHVPSLDAEPLR